MGRWGIIILGCWISGCYQAVGVTRQEADLQELTVKAWNARGDLPQCGHDCLQAIWGLDIVHTDTTGMFFVCGAGRPGCYRHGKYFAFNTDYFDDPGVYRADKNWVVIHETVHALGDFSGLGDSDHSHTDVDRRWGMWRGTVLYEAYTRALADSVRGQ